jgi:hypothetical protein
VRPVREREALTFDRNAYMRVYNRQYRLDHPNRSRKWDRERDERIVSAISTIKLDRGCIDCGYDEYPEALDFDHRDPARKTEGIARMVSKHRTFEAILAEIEKCDVRCANCHRVMTRTRQREGVATV